MTPDENGIPTPDRVVRAWQLRPGDWVQHENTVMTLMLVERGENGNMHLLTNTGLWSRLWPSQRVGIWYADPRPKPATDPNTPF